MLIKHGIGFSKCLETENMSNFDGLIWKFSKCWFMMVSALTKPAFTCSKLTIETEEQGVKYVQSQQ